LDHQLDQLRGRVAAVPVTGETQNIRAFIPVAFAGVLAQAFGPELNQDRLLRTVGDMRGAEVQDDLAVVARAVEERIGPGKDRLSSRRTIR